MIDIKSIRKQLDGVVYDAPWHHAVRALCDEVERLSKMVVALNERDLFAEGKIQDARNQAAIIYEIPLREIREQLDESVKNCEHYVDDRNKMAKQLESARADHAQVQKVLEYLRVNYKELQERTDSTIYGLNLDLGTWRARADTEYVERERALRSLETGKWVLEAAEAELVEWKTRAQKLEGALELANKKIKRRGKKIKELKRIIEAVRKLGNSWVGFNSSHPYGDVLLLTLLGEQDDLEEEL